VLEERPRALDKSRLEIVSEFGGGSRARARARARAGAQSGGGVGEAVETDDEGIETRRRRTKFTKRITPILNLVSHETIRECFEIDDQEEIWWEMNT
jgi:hypothetical protein